MLEPIENANPTQSHKCHSICARKCHLNAVANMQPPQLGHTQPYFVALLPPGEDDAVRLHAKIRPQEKLDDGDGDGKTYFHHDDEDDADNDDDNASDDDHANDDDGDDGNVNCSMSTSNCRTSQGFQLLLLHLLVLCFFCKGRQLGLG